MPAPALLWHTHTMLGQGERPGARIRRGVVHPVTGALTPCLTVALSGRGSRPDGHAHEVETTSRRVASKRADRIGVQRAPRICMSMNKLAEV